jgi:hypothetical protein
MVDHCIGCRGSGCLCFDSGNFEKALEGLLTGRPPKAEAAREAAPAGIKLSVGQLIQRANEAFQNYLRSLDEKKFDRASRALEQLESTLQDLSKEAGTGAAGEAGTGGAEQ